MCMKCILIPSKCRSCCCIDDHATHMCITKNGPGSRRCFIQLTFQNLLRWTMYLQTSWLSDLHCCLQMLCMPCGLNHSLCSSKHCTSQQSNGAHPKGIRSFWENSPFPIVKAFFKLLLHQYDVAWIMQPMTHGPLRHKKRKRVSMHF